MTTRKSNSKSENPINTKFIHELSAALLELENTNIKKWVKDPKKRGNELKSLALKKCPEWWAANSLELILSVELDIYFQEVLVSNEEMTALMSKEETIGAFMHFDWDKNPNTQAWLEMVTTRIADFGCLFTQGLGSDIGGWFEDPLWDFLSVIGAIEQN